MLDGLYVQFFGALLFCLVFLFLWKRSGVRYFGYWALAWAVESLAWICTGLARFTGSARWQAPHALLEFVFALSLVAAARAASGSERAGSTWRRSMRVLYFFPGLLLILELIGWHRDNLQGAARSAVLCAIYFYSYLQLRFGARFLFRLALLALALLNLQNFIAYLLIWNSSGGPPAWMTYMEFNGFYDVALKTILAFAAMAGWIENQNDRAVQMASELDRVRREATHEANLDYLTGLFNQDSLRRSMEGETKFEGVVAVCDLDGFKAINDRFGHMVGDEVLRNIGNLLKSSIRAEDRAYRWGGDEFAVLFAEKEERVAHNRMMEVERRLSDFRVRGHGALRIEFSWGVAEGQGEPLHAAVERADARMYARKRERALKRATVSSISPA